MDNVNDDRISCECSICKSACKNKPGWFKPDEAEKVAKYLNITMKQFFDKYLSVDWYQEDGKDYYPLSPVAKINFAGKMWPYNPTGECVFFENGRCKIYIVVPFECREYYHEDTREVCKKRHSKTAKLWGDKEEYLTKLLKHPPYPPEPNSLMDMFGFSW